MMKTHFKIKKELDHFSVDVEYQFESGVLVIQGESGAGKTTLLNCIAGLSRPDDGLISFGDQIVYDSRKKIDIPTRNRRLGYLFQNYALFPNMTVQQNINYGLKNLPEYKDKTSKLEMLQYSDYIMRTFGIDHLRKKYPDKISGGEKQRVALSRAIVTKPRLLLLDEPFGALDEKTKKIVYSEFAAFKENFNIPTILITHNPVESEMFADHRIYIKEGEIVQA